MDLKRFVYEIEEKENCCLCSGWQNPQGAKYRPCNAMMTPSLVQSTSRTQGVQETTPVATATSQGNKSIESARNTAVSGLSPVKLTFMTLVELTNQNLIVTLCLNVHWNLGAPYLYYRSLCVCCTAAETSWEFHISGRC